MLLDETLDRDFSAEINITLPQKRISKKKQFVIWQEVKVLRNLRTDFEIEVFKVYTLCCFIYNFECFFVKVFTSNGFFDTLKSSTSGSTATKA